MNQIYHEHKPDDQVFFILDGVVRRGVVIKCNIYIEKDLKITIDYNISYGIKTYANVVKKESLVYRTKEGLIASL